MALLYRCLRPNILRSSFLRHLYFAATGVLLCLFNFGHEALHSLVSILVTYLIARCFAGSGAGVIVGFLFHVGYLTAGYLNVASEKYDVTWTTAQCVLCLRHIGLLFDLWDGKRGKPVDASSSSSSAAAVASFPTPLKRAPSLVELTAHTYFFGGFLVGPQFPMARYLSFIEDFPLNGPKPENGANSSTGVSALKRLFVGLLCVAAFQVGSVLVPQSFMLTSQFLQESSFLYKMSYILLWGKIVLYKYVGCWLIAEGSCILSGMQFFVYDL